ncbi:MAG: hypothetical protein NZL83_01045 [Candidatus Absconditabacterales bacterium]|nr:hypothetical protein [Candidatus Absconditabacterales bacterium]
MDIIIVADNTTEQIEKQILDTIGNQGYYTTDRDFASKVRKINDFLNGNGKPPLDIHLISSNQYYEYTNAMQKLGGLNPEKKRIRSLHANQENHHLPFAFDFLFSMSAILETPKIMEQRILTQQSLRKNYGEGGLTHFIIKNSQRGARLLNTDKMAQKARRERIQSRS